MNGQPDDDVTETKGAAAYCGTMAMHRSGIRQTLPRGRDGRAAYGTQSRARGVTG